MKLYNYLKVAWPILFIGCISIACSSSKLIFEKEAVKQQVCSLVQCNAFTCVDEVDANVQKNLALQRKKMLQIYLIRHAKPDVRKKLFYSSKQVKHYFNDYNAAAIIPFDPALVAVNLSPNHIIYCSSLPRSQETALRIFGDKYPLVADTIFREFEIRAIDANSLFKLPLPLWQAFSRASWLLGFNHRGIESHKEAKQRAKMATENVIKIANKEETAILLAHGMLNRAIAKNLEKKGWRLIQKKGHVNLGATILVKIVDL